MNFSPLVSIILPMKNAEKWVYQTIDSIQKQTILDWELIVIDDHSTDSSYELVSKIKQLDSRVNLLKNSGFGIIPALQRGLNEAKGLFLTRIDADDLMPSNRLKAMVDFLDSQPNKTIVTGNVNYFSEIPISEGYLKYEKWLNDRVQFNDFYKHIYRECIVASPNWMGRVEDFKKYQLFDKLRYPEDYDLCFHWQENNFLIKGIDEVTLLWREHPERTSRNSGNYQQPAFFKMKLEWFLKNHTTDSSIGIIGFGSKGKICATYFHESKQAFSLYDLEFKRFQSPFLNKKILDPNLIDDELVLIARFPENTTAIQNFVESKGYEIGINAFWV